MPAWLKALLIVAIIGAVLFVGVISAGVIWWTRNKDGLRTRAKESVAMGRGFGRNTDNQGCVDESISRYKKDPGFFSALNNSGFIDGCLETSRLTPGFCDNIPLGDMMKMSAWREAQCRRYDLPNDQKCGLLFTSVMMFCGERKRNETKSQ